MEYKETTFSDAFIKTLKSPLQDKHDTMVKVLLHKDPEGNMRGHKILSDNNETISTSPNDRKRSPSKPERRTKNLYKM